jgi:hypothetical protein
VCGQIRQSHIVSHPQSGNRPYYDKRRTHQWRTVHGGKTWGINDLAGYGSNATGGDLHLRFTPAEFEEQCATPHKRIRYFQGNSNCAAQVSFGTSRTVHQYIRFALVDTYCNEVIAVTNMLRLDYKTPGGAGTPVLRRVVGV